MAGNTNGGPNKQGLDPKLEKLEFDIDADLKRLKSSSRYLAVALVILAVAFLVILFLSLGGYFEMQQTVGTIAQKYRLYTNKEIPVYKEATDLSRQIGTVGANDMLYEVQRLPGFIEILSNKEVDNHKLQGWVRAEQVSSKIDQVALSKGIDRIKPLELLVQINTTKTDIEVQGDVINNLDIPVKNIRLEIAYLGEDLQPISREITNLSPKDELKPSSKVSFSIVGKDMIKTTRYITCEIKDFDLASSTIVVPGSASTPGAAEPPADAP